MGGMGSKGQTGPLSTTAREKNRTVSEKGRFQENKEQGVK